MQFKSNKIHIVDIILIAVLASVLLTVLCLPSLMKLSGINLNEPLAGNISLNVYDMRRVLMTFPLIFLSFIYIYSNQARSYLFLAINNLPNLIKTCLVVYITTAITGSLISIAPLQSLLVSAEQILLIGLIMFISGMVYNRPYILKIILIAFVLISIVYTLLSLWIYFYLYFKGVKLPGNQYIHNVIYFYLSFTNARFFGQYLTWVLPLLSLPLLYKTSKWIRCFVFLLLVYFWMLLLINGSEALYIEWAIIYIITPFIFHRHTIRFLLFNILASVLGLCIAYLMTDSSLHNQVILLITYAIIFIFHICYISFINRIIINISTLKKMLIAIAVVFIIAVFIYKNLGYLSHILIDNGRFNIIRVTLLPLYHNLLLGIGSGLTPFYGLEFASNGMSVIVSQPHNFLVRILAENGLIGFICIFIPIFIGIVAVIKKCLEYRKNNNILPKHIILFAIMLSAILHAQVSGLLEMPVSQFMGAIIVGVMLAEFSSACPYKHVKYSKMTQQVIISFLVLLASYMLFVSYSSVVNISNTAKTRNCGMTESPFYWFVGTSAIDFPGQYFCFRKNYPELEYWSIYGPYQIRFKNNQEVNN
ncbi:hypothetical protein OAO18_01320 [Francisellaceae bacterium]|nr:hypothetical protein [Francisellaceae bacterium]